MLKTKTSLTLNIGYNKYRDVKCQNVLAAWKWQGREICYMSQDIKNNVFLSNMFLIVNEKFKFKQKKCIYKSHSNISSNTGPKWKECTFFLKSASLWTLMLVILLRLSNMYKHKISVKRQLLYYLMWFWPCIVVNMWK